MGIHNCSDCEHAAGCEDKARFLDAIEALKTGGVKGLARWTMLHDILPKDTMGPGPEHWPILVGRIEAGVNAFSLIRDMDGLRNYCSVVQKIGNAVSESVGKEFRGLFSELHLQISQEYMASTLRFSQALGEAMGSSIAVVSETSIAKLPREEFEAIKAKSLNLAKERLSIPSEQVSAPAGKVLH